MIERTQLFDLRNDPHELNDLSADPAQADRIAEMMLDLENWKSIVGDPQINEEPRLSYGDFLGLTWN